jgi:uncharacterized protein YjbI with pentapeptide repeats
MKTRKRKGSAPRRLTASERRGFDPNRLDQKSKDFIALFDLPRRTAAEKRHFLESVSRYDCTSCNLKGNVFSQKNLSGANLSKADFTNSLFNGANTKLIGTNLTEAIFNHTTMRNTDLSESKLNKAKFSNKSELKKVKLDNADLTEIEFDDCDLLDFNIENIFQSKINNLSLYNSRIQDVNFIDTKLIESVFNKCNFFGSSFSKVELKNNVFEECGFFNKSKIVLSNIIDSDFSLTKFKSSIMMRSNFNNCNFSNLFISHGSLYTNNEFKNCNFSNSDLRTSVLENNTFINCNFSNSNWRDVKFVNDDQFVEPFLECNLTNIDLQTATGLDGMNLSGLNLQGAQLKGINFQNTNFSNANLRGATFEFSDVLGANFEGANLEGTVLVGVAENWQQALHLPRNARRNRAQDTHLAFNDIDFQELLAFFSKNDISTSTDMNNNDFIGFISRNLLSYRDIANEERDNPQLSERLNGCISGRIDTWNFNDNLPGVQPEISWKKLIYPMLEYVNKQSKEFKSLYIEILVTDSAEGHGQQFSCIKGIVERLLTTTGKVVEVLRDTEKNKKEQYTQLHMIISPPFTLGTLLKEWMEIHKEGGDDPLDENDDPEELIKSFQKYAKEQYNYQEKNDIEKKLIDDKIKNDPKYGTDIIKDQFGILYFFGGKKKRRKTRKTRKNKKLKKCKKQTKKK